MRQEFRAENRRTRLYVGAFMCALVLPLTLTIGSIPALGSSVGGQWSLMLTCVVPAIPAAGRPMVRPTAHVNAGVHAQIRS